MSSRLFLFALQLALAAEPARLQRSTNIDVALEPGATRVFALELAAGESAEIVVRQRGVDVVVELTDPAGKLLDSVDGPTGRQGDEVVSVIARTSGIYALRVRPFDEREPAGSCRLEVTALRGAAETTALLEKRRKIRDSAASWLRPHSVELPTSGLIDPKSTLAPLDELAARSRVIGLGEATHGSRELNELRLALTRYLVERHGYRIIAMENSASGTEELAAYIEGRIARTPAVVRAIEWIWIGRRSRADLVEWLRAWNRAHPRDGVRVVGVDATESSNSRAILGAFLARAYGEALSKPWNDAQRELEAADRQAAVFGNSGVTTGTRKLLMEICAMLELDAPLLRARYGRDDFAAALRAAQTIAQFADFNATAPEAINHSRDWYMATGVLRALEEGGPSGKAVYWAHNAHVAHLRDAKRTAGGLLRSALDCGYAAIALTFGEGGFIAQIPGDPQNRLAASVLPRAPDDSVEAMSAVLHARGALVNWACKVDEASVPEWLRTPRSMHWIGGLYTPGSVESAAFRSFDLLRDFDGIAFLPRVEAEEIPRDRGAKK